MARYLLAMTLMAALVALVSSQGFVALDIDVDDANATPWNHYWERCVGSGRAYLGLRQDWRSDLLKAHQDLGFQMVRFHDILDDDMNVVRVNPDGSLTYSFYNVDQVYDYILSIGMKPLVELSFMPSQLAKNASETVFWYKAITSEPQSWQQWGEVISVFVSHLVDRYGLAEVESWYFEVWNEPQCGFFSGSQQDFFILFQIVSNAVHNVSPTLKVGGPVTCQNGWIEETMQFVANGTLSIDFISSHMYPTDFGTVTPTIMRDRISQVQKIGKFPLFYTEFNDGLYDPAYHDTPYAASFIVKNVVDLQGITDLLSWWTFSDIFDEGGQESQPFFKTDGWGLLSLYQIPKPSYRAFEFLHRTGTTELPITYTNSGTNSSTFGALATKNSTHLHLLFWNHNLPNLTFPFVNFKLGVKNLPSNAHLSAQVRLIDAQNGNAPAYWKDQLGAPQYPTTAQILKLRKVSELAVKYVGVDTNSDGFGVISSNGFKLSSSYYVMEVIVPLAP